MLRTTFPFGDKHRPMWYPFPLLLATAADNKYDSSRPFGCLVEVASTKDVGKTILTLQLLNDVLYKNGRALNVRDYFYPKTDFMEELYFRSIWRSRPASRPAPTNPTAGDMRAIFVRPAVVPALDPPADGNGGKSGLWQSFKQWVKGDVKEGAKYFLESTFDIVPQEDEKRKKEPFDLNKMLEEQKREFWKPVLFYDTAGESQEKRDQVIEAVGEITNKLAIVIDARDVFDIDSWREDHNASIRHASERISDMQQMSYRRKDTCIVVTKLDMVNFTPEQKEEVKNIAEGISVGDAVARAMLVAWLREHSDDDKESLIQHLDPMEDVVGRVFFVWTENLPKMRGIRMSPIFAFKPLSGGPGEEITITANQGFHFQDAKKVLFDGREAKFNIISDTEITAHVPQGASSGYIDIVLESIDPITNHPVEDDANSEGVFIVTGSKKPAVVGKPHSYGLVKFLAWCLDKSVAAITKTVEAVEREAQV
jgi:hypothetical protein